MHKLNFRWRALQTFMKSQDKPLIIFQWFKTNASVVYYYVVKIDSLHYNKFANLYFPYLLLFNINKQKDKEIATFPSVSLHIRSLAGSSTHCLNSIVIADIFFLMI